MAPRLSLWLGAALAGCVAVGVAYLPPKHAPREPTLRGSTFRPPSAARLRENGLAYEWRAADRALRLARYRERLGPSLARLRSAGAPGAALLVDVPLGDTVSGVIAAALDTVWRRLALGAPKISIGVVIAPDRPVRQASTPVPVTERSSAPAFLLPDSTDRITCVAMVPTNAKSWRDQALAARIEARRGAWIRSGLGPCAFYAAFGRPGAEIERWLRSRRFDVAAAVDWDVPRPNRAPFWWGWQGESRPWFWQQVYDLPFDAVACTAGRADPCGRAILAAVPATGGPDRWWRRQGLPGVEGYLADLVRTMGRDRFREFWSSDLPVDSAYATAFQEPIGAGTRRWERGIVSGLLLGPGTPSGAAAFGLLLATLCVTLAVLGASRRQVR